jgi:hypothetical protein
VVSPCWTLHKKHELIREVYHTLFLPLWA